MSSRTRATAAAFSAAFWKYSKKRSLRGRKRANAIMTLLIPSISLVLPPGTVCTHVPVELLVSYHDREAILCQNASYPWGLFQNCQDLFFLQCFFVHVSIPGECRKKLM